MTSVRFFTESLFINNETYCNHPNLLGFHAKHNSVGRVRAPPGVDMRVFAVSMALCGSTGKECVVQSGLVVYMRLKLEDSAFFMIRHPIALLEIPRTSSQHFDLDMSHAMPRSWNS